MEITTVVAGGDGLGRDADGRVTFVAGALPARPCRVDLHQQKKDFARGTVLEVVAASPDRVAPPCPFVAAGCGGCDWQHVAPAAQRRLKAAIVADALRRQAKVEVVVGRGPGPPGHGLPHHAPRASRSDGRFGLRRRHSHDADRGRPRASSPTRWSTSWSPTAASPTARWCSGPAPAPASASSW